MTLRCLLACVAIALVSALPARATSGEQEFVDAVSEANSAQICGFPPLERTFEINHESAIRIVRCLNRRGSLSDEALAGLAADPTFELKGSWEGVPGESGLTWSSPTMTVASAFSTALTPTFDEPVDTTTWLVVGLIGLCVAAALLVGWVRPRRRNTPHKP